VDESVALGYDAAASAVNASTDVWRNVVNFGLQVVITGGNVSPQRLSTGIRRLREARDMTQQELATRAGLTQGYVSQLESGLKQSPSLPTLRKLARALGVPVAELLT
jgi:DNA-binding XRE family transcriptional regulator